MEKRINCWEFMKCGKDGTSDCPAFPNGGRICFFIAGTMCGGKVQGIYALKIKHCRECDFYRAVRVDKAMQ